MHSREAGFTPGHVPGKPKDTKAASIAFSMLLAMAIFLILFSVNLPVSAQPVQPILTEPDDGANLTQSPQMVKILFGEELGAGKTTVSLGDGRGRQVELASGGLDERDVTHKALIVEVPALAEGVYSVDWDVRAVDGEPAHGSFQFGVGNVTALSNFHTAFQEATSAQQSLIIYWLAGMAAFIILVGGALFFMQLKTSRN